MVGDYIKVILFNGMCMVFGILLWVSSYFVVYVFMVGYIYIDWICFYMLLDEV